MRDHVKTAAAFCEQLEVEKLDAGNPARGSSSISFESSIAPFEDETSRAGVFGKDI